MLDLSELIKYLDEFKDFASSDGLAFVDKVNGEKVNDLMSKYGYAKRTMYSHVEKGKKEFLKYLEEKDVWL